jgi:hypothetical protein
VLVGFYVLKQIISFLFGQIFTLGVGVIHGDIAVREVWMDDLHFILLLLLFALVVGEVDLALEIL